MVILNKIEIKTTRDFKVKVGQLCISIQWLLLILIVMYLILLLGYFNLYIFSSNIELLEKFSFINILDNFHLPSIISNNSPNGSLGFDAFAIGFMEVLCSIPMIYHGNKFIKFIKNNIKFKILKS